MKFIVEHGWTTSSVLAGEFSLTSAAIRRHLTYLETSGMLVARSQPASLRKGAGRPAREYAATTRGRQTFSQAYDTFAISAVETLRRLGGEEAVTGFFEERFQAIEARFAELRVLEPELSETESLSIALTQDGFMAGLEPMGKGGTGEQLCQHNCPYPAIAARFPELCSVETSVFSRLLRSHVQRLATIAHGDGVCTTHIPAPQRKESQ